MSNCWQGQGPGPVLDLEDGLRTKTVALGLTSKGSKITGLGHDALTSTPVTHL